MPFFQCFFELQSVAESHSSCLTKIASNRIITTSHLYFKRKCTFYKMCATWNLESMWQHSHLGWNSHLFVEWFPYCIVSWFVWSCAMPVCVFTPGTVGRVHKVRPVFSSGWSDRHLYCAVWNLSPCEVNELKQMWSSSADRFSSSSQTLVQ